MAVAMNMSILIVDDQKTMLRIIKNLLTQLGFTNVDDALNGSMALIKLKEKKFDLIISDWNMEPMSGFDLLKSVRTDDEIKNIPFIMITAESRPENVVAAKQAGINEYIVKPFSAQTLKEKLQKVIGEF